MVRMVNPKQNARCHKAGVVIALFKVICFHLHYNVIQHGCEAILG